jgi:hypothetical protein
VGVPALERAHEESDAAVAGEHWPKTVDFVLQIGLRGNFLNKINARVAGTYRTAAKIDIRNINVISGRSFLTGVRYATRSAWCRPI